MIRPPFRWTMALLIACTALASCGGRGFNSGGVPPGGTAPIVLAMTDTPPTNMSILSAEVILTGATLNPGNVSLLTTQPTVELTRLQTDIAYLGTTKVVPGSYTSLTLTFANPSLTIENDTTLPIGTCAVGTICTISPTTANLSTTITIPTLTAKAGTAAGLLVDVNLDKLLSLLSATLAADFKAGTTVSEFTPAGSGAPLVGAEDLVGQVKVLDAVHNTFSFQNAAGQLSLAVDSSTTFLQFPSSLCTTSVFTCLRANQILSVDIGIRADGTPVARNVLFEDTDNSDTEVEGTIINTNVGSQQFMIVTLGESATVTGLNIGETATVHYAGSPQTPFDVDFAHADNVQVNTAGFLFAAPADLAIGQQVQVRRNPSTSATTSITADRVRLRSSRITATAQSPASDIVPLTNVPSIFSGNGVTQIRAHTSAGITIFSENNNPININMIPNGSLVSVRGPLFNVSSARTLLATKVVLKP